VMVWASMPETAPA